MKIRIESEYFAATFQSIFNWNDIKIATNKANVQKNNFFEYNENGKKLRGSWRQNIFYVKYSYSVLPFCNVCYCYHNDAKRIRKEAKGSVQRRRLYSILQKLTQFCFVFILLLPLLLTCNTLIQEATGEDVKPIPTISSESRLFWASSTYMHYGQKGPKAKSNCQNKWNFKLMFNNYTNHNNYNKNDNQNDIMNSHSHSITKGMSLIYPSNHSLNEYSLIITLSQLYSKNKANLHSKAHTILHGTKPSSGTDSGSGSNNIRPKRSIDSTPHKSQPPKTKRKHETGSQKLDVFEKHKKYHQTHNRIINTQKVTELIMNGLGLKKLPDMKKVK